MVRSSPSAADGRLIALLAEEDAVVSPAQLERWRQRGLLPRSRVLRRGWGGSEVADHPQAVLEAAYVLAQVAGRGRSWQYGGVILFERGFMLTTPCLRACATWVAESLRRRLSRAWEEASAEIGSVPHCQRFPKTSRPSAS